MQPSSWMWETLQILQPQNRLYGLKIEFLKGYNAYLIIFLIVFDAFLLPMHFNGRLLVRKPFRSVCYMDWVGRLFTRFEPGDHFVFRLETEKCFRLEPHRQALNTSSIFLLIYEQCKWFFSESVGASLPNCVKAHA